MPNKSPDKQNNENKNNEQTKLEKSIITYDKWQHTQRSKNNSSHTSHSKAFFANGEGLKFSSRMPSRGTVVIPRSSPQRQPNPAKDARDIPNNNIQRGYRFQAALDNRRSGIHFKDKQRRDFTRQIKRCPPKGEWKKKAHTTSQQRAWKAESLKITQNKQQQLNNPHKQQNKQIINGAIAIGTHKTHP